MLGFALLQMVTVNKWVRPSCSTWCSSLYLTIQLLFSSSSQVLVKTAMPIFFLFAQLSIAVVLLAVSHLFGIFVVPEYVCCRLTPGCGLERGVSRADFGCLSSFLSTGV